MNRLVIVGNGFDLAHGLPTSYGHFIDDFWTNIKNSNHNELVEFNIGRFVEFNGHKNLNDLIDLIVSINGSFKREGISLYKLKEHLKPLADNRIQIINYKNHFFKLINESTIKNWVDIENIYYKNLKERAKGEINKQNYIWDIKQLNKEFEQVKNLFEIYLNKIDRTEGINDYILKYFKLIKENIEDYFLEFPKQDREQLEKFQNDYDFNREVAVNKITYCLNFNYTQTIDKYIRITEEFKNYRNYGKVVNLQIHGRLNDINNRINFGFGDEMDDDYKAIENLDNNEYLKNFKSFQYLQNSNYKTLLDFIDSTKFQVLVMGHSCGLSDRTLLNTIFEHNNCRSIKVFYHQKEDGTNNYTEIIQNISRHFNKKKLMREKIVNKTLCQPLPQIQMPKK